MPKISEVIECLETFAPLTYQESFDNSGLQVGNIHQDVTSVLLCTDVTENTICEAISKNANLIISHHPLLFSGLKRISGNNYIERVVIQAISNDIVIYSSHTNMDKCIEGVSYRMAKKLGLQNVCVLHPDTYDSSIGLGCIGTMPEPVEEHIFFENLKSIFNLTFVRHSSLIGKPISTVALCGGSGSGFISDAIRQHADIYITADIKYHDFFLAENNIIIADIGHFESEKYTKDIFYEQLIDFFPNFAVLMAESDKNPVFYI